MMKMKTLLFRVKRSCQNEFSHTPCCFRCLSEGTPPEHQYALSNTILVPIRRASICMTCRAVNTNHHSLYDPWVVADHIGYTPERILDIWSISAIFRTSENLFKNYFDGSFYELLNSPQKTKITSKAIYDQILNKNIEILQSSLDAVVEMMTTISKHPDGDFYKLQQMLIEKYYRRRPLGRKPPLPPWAMNEDLPAVT